ncbi:hypothetical protein PPACK8108_LOCUS23322 [Phakopsora pachyrhizi]|uniref:N-acetyltransferase domain-containing protein n=1 Tax=Phakopsora pachyrhizi TaxID=170000 RepID=A0AAV0BQA7_PHAPC|nr:hypothetical protein PPACK8108_LOCUS23322 [Phakopsora pachyrhizi]
MIRFLTIVPIDYQTAPADSILKDDRTFGQVWKHLSDIFDKVLIDGRTYPQESQLGSVGFKNYFLSHDFFLGVSLDKDQLKDPKLKLSQKKLSLPLQQKISLTTFDSNNDTSLSTVTEDQLNLSSEKILHYLSDGSRFNQIVGMHYIKPNYPGRSSHLCNGGFVVDPRYRGYRFGKALAKSFLHYAPKLGYKGSVFNLVYTNNHSSVAIWDSLGFNRVGLIPRAGRLKCSTEKSPEGEEYVDAIVYHRSFS